jgi:hypothetical protein
MLLDFPAAARRVLPPVVRISKTELRRETSQAFAKRYMVAPLYFFAGLVPQYQSVHGITSGGFARDRILSSQGIPFEEAQTAG